MAWFYLLLASLFEIGWTFSLKILSVKKLLGISWKNFFKSEEGIITLLPLLLYIILGVANIYFFSLALKQISTSIAFAVWMSITLIGIKLVELFFYKTQVSLKEVFFIGLIIIGIIGLKKQALVN